MPLVWLNEANDPRLAQYRDVPEPQLLRTGGVFVAESRRVVERIIEDGHYRLRSVLLNEAAHLELEPSLARLDGDVPIYVCPPAYFQALTGFNVHRGCLALVERPRDRNAGELLALPGPRTVVVLEAIANADNIGGVFRNAAAFGVDAVLLSPDCCDPLYRKAIRTSLAATLRVPFARADEWPGGLSALRSSGFTVVALTPREPSEELSAFAAKLRPERLALVVGSEGEGVSASVEEMADVRVRIPIDRSVDSLNVAVAVGIALHRLSART